MTLFPVKRPRLSAKVVRGIGEMIPVLDVLLDQPSDNDFQGLSTKQLRDAHTALDYLRQIRDWHDAKNTAK